MKKLRQWKPRIRLVEGRWRAVAPNNSHEAMGALIPAISYCRRINAARAKGGA